MSSSKQKLTCKKTLWQCLAEFIDWRYSQSCWYFRPSFVYCCPFSLVEPPPPPLSVNSTAWNRQAFFYSFFKLLQKSTHAAQSNLKRLSLEYKSSILSCWPNLIQSVLNINQLLPSFGKMWTGAGAERNRRARELTCTRLWIFITMWQLFGRRDCVCYNFANVP
jgi:hypothetical protein